LYWSGGGDLDLHITEPDGIPIFANVKRGLTGFLVQNSVDGTGPERYVGPCDPYVFKEGTYRVAVNNYKAAAGTVAFFRASSITSGIFAQTSVVVGGPLGPVGNVIPQLAFEFTISSNPLTGLPTFTVK
jgi:uncharacterized protein YfaP (DUF2135 family)